jgi:hypothetical protein
LSHASSPHTQTPPSPSPSGGGGGSRCPHLLPLVRSGRFLVSSTVTASSASSARAGSRQEQLNRGGSTARATATGVALDCHTALPMAGMRRPLLSSPSPNRSKAEAPRITAAVWTEVRDSHFSHCILSIFSIVIDG